MADYWITNPRHYCDVCKCWLGNNKISIENHEKGPRHRENVERRLRETRKRAAIKEREEEKVTETLAQIEKAATAAYKRDQKGLPPRESSFVKKALAEEKKNKGKKSKEPVPAVPPPPPSPWQQLLSPEGCVYYYHILTGVSQWECPPELRKPSNKTTPPVSKGSSTYGTFTRNSKGSIVPTTSTGADSLDEENSIQAEWIKRNQERDEFLQRPFTELAATVKYYTQDDDDDEEKEGESGEDSRPPQPKRFDPYGAWQTIAIRTQETPKQEEKEEEEEEKEEEEETNNNSSDDECTFKEKTLPSTGLDIRGGVGVKDEEQLVAGNFKSFSFKKSGGSRNIKKRTSQW